MTAQCFFRSTVLLCLLLLAACGCGGPAPAAPNPAEQAAVEATALVQSALATALIRDAQAKATALSAGPASPGAPVSTRVLPASTPLPVPATEVTTAPRATVADPGTVQVMGVGIAGEGGFVMVNFLAPPEVAAAWYQGAVWVEDEATGQLYSEIGVVPVVGPLFGRPVEPGQPGYVMLVNNPNPLAPGAVVTVVLGEYRFEHLPIE